MPDGGEPKELIRDAALNESVGLPIVGRDRLRIGERTRGTGDGPQGTFGRGQVPPGGFQAGTVGREFVFQAGQPEAVRQACREAMGIVD